MVYRFISIAVLVLGTSVAPVAHAALPLVLPGGAGEADVALPSLADMLERTNPAVVNIATRTTVVERNRLLADPFFRRFFNIPESRRRYRRTQSAGSGVVVSVAAAAGAAGVSATCCAAAAAATTAGSGAVTALLSS